MPDKVETHPVQGMTRDRKQATAPVAVTMRAYEVYYHVYNPQVALVTGGCRGGFGVGELVAFLYARSFPKEEWRERFVEACEGLHIG